MGNITSKKKPPIVNDKFNFYCEIRKDNESVISFPYDKRNCTFGQEYIYFTIPKQKIEPFPHKFEFVFRDQTYLDPESEQFSQHDVKIKFDRCELSIYQNQPSIIQNDKMKYQEHQIISDRSGTFIFRIPNTKNYKSYELVYIRRC